MKNQKTISIITVTFNCESLIENTIKSVLEQNSNQIEYIIIDGQSTDKTNSIINKYSEQVDYYISEKDNGIYDAMNKGLKAATGAYVIYINAGDLLYDQHTVSKLIEIINSKTPDIIFGETMLIDGSGKTLGTRSENSSRKLPKALNWKSLKRGMVVSHQSFLVKRALAPAYNLQFTSSADVDWVIKCLKKSKVIINANMIISKYLIGGYSKETLQTSLGERFKIFNHHYGFFSNLLNHFIITIRAFQYKIKRKDLN